MLENNFFNISKDSFFIYIISLLLKILEILNIFNTYMFNQCESYEGTMVSHFYHVKL
jgi:hypothetical protein